MSASEAFNYDFYETREKELISFLQKKNGCFTCRKPGATQKCSRCKVAVYCNRQCQLKDWKKPGHHKEICSVWCDNRGSGPQDETSVSVPICMKSCGYIPDDLMLHEMRLRGDAFLDEIRRCANCGDTDNGINFQAAVIYSVGGIRLATAASFYSQGLEKVVSVNHVLFESVDEGEEAKQRLYPTFGGSGEISRRAKALVVTKLTELVGRLADRDLHVGGITYGRGLMWLSDDEAKEAKETIEERNGEVNGVHRRIIWIPSTDYVVSGAMGAAMRGFMSDFST